LGEVTVAYETWGKLNEDASNAILVLHALSGDSHVSGPPKRATRTQAGGSMVGGTLHRHEPLLRRLPERARRLSRDHRSELVGGGREAIRIAFSCRDGEDQVVVERALGYQLGIDTCTPVVGGSMGGMRAMQWAVDFPANVERAIVIAAGAVASAEQIALCWLQSQAIRLDRTSATATITTRHAGQWPAWQSPAGLAT